MVKFEYWVLACNTIYTIEAEMNNLGSQGWELVCQVGDTGLTFLFKRKV